MEHCNDHLSLRIFYYYRHNLRTHKAGRALFNLQAMLKSLKVERVVSTCYHGERVNHRTTTWGVRKICCCHGLRPNENIFNWVATHCDNMLTRPMGEQPVLGEKKVLTCRTPINDSADKWMKNNCISHCAELWDSRPLVTSVRSHRNGGRSASCLPGLLKLVD